MRVRVARLSDARAIAEVHVASWLATYRGLVSDRVLDELTVETREGLWRETLADPESFVFVAEKDDRVVGLCAGKHGEIGATYVHPDHVRSGVGTALLTAALHTLRESGSDAVVLWVFEANTPAVSFYERHGFAPDGERTTHGDWAQGAVAIRLRLELQQCV
jgi:ribosomal protein S18 acetylase RimI-like enzyme